MVSKIRKIQILNDQVFAEFNKYLHKPEKEFSHLHNAKIVHFDPPKSKLESVSSAGTLQLEGGKIADVEA